MRARKTLVYVVAALSAAVVMSQAPAPAAKTKPNQASRAVKGIKFNHRHPCNLFEKGKSVTMELSVSTDRGTRVTVAYKAVDYFDKVVAEGEETVEAASRGVKIPLALGNLDNGWYRLSCEVTRKKGNASGTTGVVETTLGVAPFSHRTREESLARGLRFGMRHRNRDYEGLDACLLLGMPWERNLYINPGAVAKSPDKSEWDWSAALQTYKEHALDRQIILINKVELFPGHCYDAERYGPKEEYKDPVGKHPWSKRTVPEEQCYREWVRELTRRMPPSQRIFEVWNEPWGKYPPEDFARILIWTAEEIKDVRPDAIVGPDSGNIGYDIELARHNAFKDCDMVTIHPYVFHPERGGIRSKIRLYREFMREHIGRDLPLYTTEWGFRAGRPKQQAAYMARQAMAMYAEDIKALIPYIFTPSKREARSGTPNFYGYVSYEMEPFPALLSYATCARMIDGGRFVGDLWMGELIGAMLFERDGVHTAALWTDGEPREVSFDAGVPSLKMVDIMGVEKAVETAGKPLALTLTDDPIYLVGVSPGLADKAAVLEDIAKRWPIEEKEVVRHCPSAATPPAIDGQIDEAEWKGALTLVMGGENHEQADIGAVARLMWDPENLYLGIDITDDDPMNNTCEDVGVFKQDSIELYVSAKPEMRIPETRGQYDYQVVISPTSKSGEPVNYLPGHGSKIEARLKGEKMVFKKREGGWIAEMSLPLTNFPGFPTEKGKKAAFEILINDFDADNPVGRRNKIKPVDSIGTKYHRDAAPWGLLVLD